MLSHKNIENRHIWSIIDDSIYIEDCKFGEGAEAILNFLMEYYVGEEHAIHLFLTTHRVSFLGQTALEIINSQEGQILIQDHIYRLKAGDIS